MDTHNATEEIRIMSAFSKKFLPTLSYAISASLPNFSKSRAILQDCVQHPNGR